MNEHVFTGRRALSFGFGGYLVSSLEEQVSIFPLAEFASELDLEKIHSFDPITPTDSISQVESICSDRISTAPSVCLEDGQLSGSTLLLWRVLMAHQSPLHFHASVLSMLQEDRNEEVHESDIPVLMAQSAMTPQFEAQLEQLMLLGNLEDCVLFCLEHELHSQALVMANFISATCYRRVVSHLTNKPSNGDGGNKIVAFTLQLLAGRGVDAVNKCCTRRNWKALVRILLTTSVLDQAVVLVHLGDKLWRDFHSVSAAHVCYMLANKLDNILLLGGDHLFQLRTCFLTPHSVMLSELFFKHPQQRRAFQPFRLVFAMWLADLGLVLQAKKWVQSIQAEVLSSHAEGVSEEGFLDQLAGFEARLNRDHHQQQHVLPAAAMAKLDAPPILDLSKESPLKQPPPTLFAVEEPLEGPTSTVQTETVVEPLKEEEVPPSALSNPFGMQRRPVIKPFEHFHSTTTPKKKLFVPVASSSSSSPPQPLPPPPPLPVKPLVGTEPKPVAKPVVTPAPPAASSSSSSDSSWFMGFRGWLTQKLVPLPGNSTAAKTGEKLSAHYDDNLKRWVFPGETSGSEPPPLGGPPLLGKPPQ